MNYLALKIGGEIITPPPVPTHWGGHPLNISIIYTAILLFFIGFLFGFYLSYMLFNKLFKKKPIYYISFYFILGIIFGFFSFTMLNNFRLIESNSSYYIYILSVIMISEVLLTTLHFFYFRKRKVKVKKGNEK